MLINAKWQIFLSFFPLQIPKKKYRIGYPNSPPCIFQFPFPIHFVSFNNFNLVQCNEIKCKNVTHTHTFVIFNFCYSEEEISSILGILQIWIIIFSRFFFLFTIFNERARFFCCFICYATHCFCFRFARVLKKIKIKLYSIRQNCSK